MEQTAIETYVASDDSRLTALRREMVTPESARALSGIFKVLSDPTRVRLISLLVIQELCVGDLAAALEVSESVVSHQLRDLRQIGWVRSRQDGRFVHYALDDAHVRELYNQALAPIMQG